MALMVKLDLNKFGEGYYTITLPKDFTGSYMVLSVEGVKVVECRVPGISPNIHLTDFGNTELGIPLPPSLMMTPIWFKTTEGVEYKAILRRPSRAV